MTDDDRKPTLTMTPSLQLAIRLLAVGGDDLRALIDTEIARIGGAARIGTVDDGERLMQPVAELDEGPPVPVARFVPFGLNLDMGPPPDVVMGRDGRAQFFLPSGVFVVPCVDRSHAHLRDAVWLTRSLTQRAKTITRIAQAMIDEDPDTFLGDAAFMSQSIRKLADKVGMHESTIKRVAQHARLLCPAGTFTFAAVLGMR